MTRCGTIVLAGRPNVGKSTLLNALVGERLAITSPRPQTTRVRVTGIRTEEDTQLIFVDPPGLLEPAYLLHEAMLEEAQRAVKDADAILYLHPANELPWPAHNATDPQTTAAEIRNLIGAEIPPKPALLVLSKADLVPQNQRPAPPPGACFVSATSGEGIDQLLEWCRQQIPEGPFLYDPEYTSNQPLRFFAAEFVREAAFSLLGEELPYAVAVEIEEFRENSDPVYIRATVYVERESQKGMVIGKEGRMIKAIGERARAAIEGFIGSRVYLDLRVKTLPKWRRRPDALRRLGFNLPTQRQR
ncbi:GTPase Era [bacterium HR33]|nr:GTPase Era [bacterium HR33]